MPNLRPWVQLAALVLGALAAHELYRLWGTHEARAWWQYRFRGAEGVILWLAVWSLWRPSGGLLRWLIPLVCFWGAFQEFETVACSFGPDVVPAVGTGLCTAHFGVWPNILLASGAFAALGVFYVRGSKDGAIRSRHVRCAAPRWALGAATWTAAVRAVEHWNQAIKTYFRVR